MINLILTEAEAKVTYYLLNIAEAYSHSRFDLANFFIEKTNEVYMDMTIGDLDKYREKLHNLHKSTPCGNPDCEFHYPRENADSNTSDAGRSTSE